MSDNKDDILGNLDDYEEIFKNLRAKYHLDDNNEKKKEEPVKTFYNPEQDTEIEDFFNERSKLCEEKAEEYMDVEEDKETSVADETKAEEAKATQVQSQDVEWDDSIVLDFSKTKNKNNEVKNDFEDISSSNSILENINEVAEKKEEQEQVDVPEDATQIVGEIAMNEATKVIDNSEIVEETSEEPIVEFAEETIVEEESKDSSDEMFDSNDLQTPKEIKKEMKRIKRENKKKNKKGIFPKKGDSAGEVIRKIVMIISVLVIIVSSAWIINDLVIQPFLAKKTNDSVSSIIDNTNFDALSNKDKEISHKELLAKNKEYVGWLTVTGGDVSLPVVKATDNDKYLHRSFYLKYLYAGTLFVDARNHSLNDKNLIIYGHNMNNGSMFGNLRRYKNANAEFYKKNSYIVFNTINGNYKYKIYAAYLADGSGSNDNSFITQAVKTDFTNESFLTYLTAVKEKAYYDTGVTVDENDRIITLVTCDRTRIKNGRLIVVGKLVEVS